MSVTDKVARTVTREALIWATRMVAKALYQKRLEIERTKSVSTIVIGYRDDLTRQRDTGKDFDPNQPRVPAGNDRGGEWTSTGIGGASRIPSERRASLLLSESERRRLADSGLLLHGTSADFTEFAPGGHQAVYFSDPANRPDTRTQAEGIANGEFGGRRLVAVKLDKSKLKYFDPYNDPIAKRIWLEIYPPGSFRNGSEGAMFLDYTDMHRIVALASAYGYNWFKVYEPSVHGWSYAITDLSAITIVEEWLLDKTVTKAVKSVSSIVVGYRDDLTRNFQDVMDGSMSIAEASRAHRTSLRHDAEMVYIEGLAEGDVPANEIDNDDRQAIAEWVSEQSGYVGPLWQDVKRLDASDTVAVRGMYERLGMWADSLRSLGALARASALANTMGTWKVGPTEDSCRDCQRLNGSTHRLSWFTSRGFIPQQPGSESLSCHGYNCLCTIRSKSGKVLLP